MQLEEKLVEKQIMQNKIKYNMFGDGGESKQVHFVFYVSVSAMNR